MLKGGARGNIYQDTRLNPAVPFEKYGYGAYKAKALKMLGMIADKDRSDPRSRDMMVTYNHSLGTANLAYETAINSGMLTEKQCVDIYLAALVHDVGKTQIDNDILNKQGKLTEEEFNIMNSHAAISMQMVKDAGFPPTVCEIVGYHHLKHPDREEGYERNVFMPTAIDGGLDHNKIFIKDGKPSEIRDGKKVLSVPSMLISHEIMNECDVFNALVTPRPYKKSYSLAKCFAIAEDGPVSRDRAMSFKRDQARKALYMGMSYDITAPDAENAAQFGSLRPDFRLKLFDELNRYAVSLNKSLPDFDIHFSGGDKDLAPNFTISWGGTVLAVVGDDSHTEMNRQETEEINSYELWPVKEDRQEDDISL